MVPVERLVPGSSLQANMVDRASSLTEIVPKWKLALAIGAPVAVGMVGIWWYRKRGQRPQASSLGNTKNVTMEDVGAETGDAGLVS